MRAGVHPSSVVSPDAKLGARVSIGPFCLVDGAVALGDDCVLHSHVVVTGRTSIGARTQIYPFASIGHAPQDLKYRGEDNALAIGADCIVREGVTINPGTAAGGGTTRIGDHCVLLAQAHVAHDCRLGDHVVLSNNVMLAGHVSIGDHAILGGGAGVIQFARIGAHAFVGGMSGVECDVAPYCVALGNRARLAGLNLVGLRRRGFSRETIEALRRVYAELFETDAPFADKLSRADDAAGGDGHARAMAAFVRGAGERPLCRPGAMREA
ncbi:MAG: acyl-ACP--UDP-N-acetylglucosamine O-acyltransferase [Hyphomicrobiales bacterium]|nr:acyl-ACP--UDP-N-acetylglucosamine O-acyltransferase [Hyphomicrobiales bacterium]